MNNIELFNVIAGSLFAKLYQKFPEYVEIDFNSLCTDLIAKNDYATAWDMPEFAKATVHWLSDAGYIWLKSPQHL